MIDTSEDCKKKPKKQSLNCLACDPNIKKLTDCVSKTQFVRFILLQIPFLKRHCSAQASGRLKIKEDAVTITLDPTAIYCNNTCVINNLFTMCHYCFVCYRWFDVY